MNICRRFLDGSLSVGAVLCPLLHFLAEPTRLLREDSKTLDRATRELDIMARERRFEFGPSLPASALGRIDLRDVIAQTLCLQAILLLLRLCERVVELGAGLRQTVEEPSTFCVLSRQRQPRRRARFL
jgi:hypothetical protein